MIETTWKAINRHFSSSQYQAQRSQSLLTIEALKPKATLAAREIVGIPSIYRFTPLTAFRYKKTHYSRYWFKKYRKALDFLCEKVKGSNLFWSKDNYRQPFEFLFFDSNNQLHQFHHMVNRGRGTLPPKNSASGKTQPEPMTNCYNDVSQWLKNSLRNETKNLSQKMFQSDTSTQPMLGDEPTFNKGEAVREDVFGS